MSLRLILNGKKAGNEQLREAVSKFRQATPLEVRVTYEGGDVERLIYEANKEGEKRVIVAGGDGTVNEAVNALMKIEHSQRPALAILPMGTANDFACSANIPTEYLSALTLAFEGHTHEVDVVEVDKRFFINVASAGFGAKITATTPPALKNLLGGGAYTLAGLVQALSFVPYSGQLFFARMVSTVPVRLLPLPCVMADKPVADSYSHPMRILMMAWLILLLSPHLQFQMCLRLSKS